MFIGLALVNRNGNSFGASNLIFLHCYVQIYVSMLSAVILQFSLLTFLTRYLSISTDLYRDDFCKYCKL